LDLEINPLLVVILVLLFFSQIIADDISLQQNLRESALYICANQRETKSLQ
jgi:hypothetical protein